MTDTVAPGPAGAGKPAQDNNQHLTAWPTLEDLPGGVWVYHTAQEGHLLGAWDSVSVQLPGGWHTLRISFISLQDGRILTVDTFEPGESFTRLPHWEEIAALRSRVKELEQELATRRACQGEGA